MLIALSPQNTKPPRRIFALASSICSGILRNLHFTTSISPQTRAITFCQQRRSTHSGQVSSPPSLFPTQATRLASSRVSTWFSDAIMVHTHRRSLNLVSNGMLRMHGRRINISRWRPYARSLPTYQSGRSRSRKQGNLPLHLCQADSLGWRRTLYPDKRSGMGRMLHAREAAQISMRYLVRL